MSARSGPKKRRPATTPEGRENQLITLAVNLAEKQLIEGSASAQVITHYLKLASTREKLEQQKIQLENLKLSAQIAAMESAKVAEELFEKAIEAMRAYRGEETGEGYYE
jgi:hypothetical protein